MLSIGGQGYLSKKSKAKILADWIVKWYLQSYSPFTSAE